MEHVRTILQNEYGITVYEQRTRGAQTVLHTDRGLYYLYTCPAAYRQKQRLIELVSRHVQTAPQLRLLPFSETLHGKRHVQDGGELYYLQPAVREAVPDQLPFATGQALAEFHQTTKDVKGELFFPQYRSLGGWPAMWRKRLRRYEAYRDRMDEDGREITPIDQHLLTSYTYVHHLGETAIQYLHDCGYHKVVKETAKYGRVSYQNFDHGYILFAEDGTRHLSGQFAWQFDMRTRDIGQWLKADIRSNGWDPERVSQFLQGYNSVAPLLPAEYSVVYALLLFPGRFLRYVELYHRLAPGERREWEEQRWQQQLDGELLALGDAVCDFPGLIEARFGVHIAPVRWLWRGKHAEAASAQNVAAESAKDAAAASTRVLAADSAEDVAQEKKV
jgi:spore coat protein YutH